MYLLNSLYVFDSSILDALSKILVALLCGFIIGAEREYRGKSAGLRTNMLICMGSCLFMIVSLYVAKHSMQDGFLNADPSRIAAQVVTGIGFLGAGAIIQHRGGISGLTTAAVIFGDAALGLAAGAGMFTIAIVTSITYLVCIELFFYLSKHIRLRTYRYLKLEVVFGKQGTIQDIRSVLRNLDLTFIQENNETLLGESHYRTLVYLDGRTEDIVIYKLLKRKGVKTAHFLNMSSDL